MNDFDGWKIATAMASLVAAIVAWVAKSMHAEQQRQGARIEMIERSYISREELAKALTDLKSDRQGMHAENTQHLDRIEQKLDAIEERHRESRHDLANKVQEIALKVAKITSARPRTPR